MCDWSVCGMCDWSVCVMCGYSVCGMCDWSVCMMCDCPNCVSSMLYYCIHPCKLYCVILYDSSYYTSHSCRRQISHGSWGQSALLDTPTTIVSTARYTNTRCWKTRSPHIAFLHFSSHALLQEFIRSQMEGAAGDAEISTNESTNDAAKELPQQSPPQTPNSAPASPTIRCPEIPQQQER